MDSSLGATRSGMFFDSWKSLDQLGRGNESENSYEIDCGRFLKKTFFVSSFSRFSKNFFSTQIGVLTLECGFGLVVLRFSNNFSTVIVP